MGYITTKGIVLKEVYTGDADKIITVLSGEYGKISIYAKGARRPRSNLSACSQFLCYSEFVLFKGRSSYSINSAQIIESFHKASGDLDRFTYACHIAEIVADTAMEDQNSENELKLLLYACHMMINLEKSPELITCIFKFKYLCILGFTPGSECNDPENSPAFCFEKCSIIDSENDSSYAILPGTAMAINHIISANIEKVFSFNVSDRVLEQLVYISDRFLDLQLDKTYKRKIWF